MGRKVRRTRSAQLATYLDADLNAALHEFSDATDKSITEIVEAALVRYLSSVGWPCKSLDGEGANG